MAEGQRMGVSRVQGVGLGRIKLGGRWLTYSQNEHPPAKNGDRVRYWFDDIGCVDRIEIVEYGPDEPPCTDEIDARCRLLAIAAGMFRPRRQIDVYSGTTTAIAVCAVADIFEKWIWKGTADGDDSTD